MEKGCGYNNRDNISRDEASQPERLMISFYYDRQQWMEEGYRWIKMQSAFFYADNGMLASTNLVWIQTAFDTLTDLFDWVGLNTNV